MRGVNFLLAVLGSLFLAGCLSQREGNQDTALEELAGQYALPPHGVFNIRVVDHRLMCRFTGQEYFELVSAGGRFNGDDGSYAVFEREGRHVRGLRWFQNGKDEYAAVRISRMPAEENTRFVEANGSRYRVRLLGSGTPVVVLESTLGGALETWETVQSNLATRATVVSYDRAGLGLSRTRSEPRDAKQISRELRGLLAALKLKAPFLAVGYSAGGGYMRVFAGEFEKEICGLVLVEPSQLKFERWMKENDATAYQASYDTASGSAGFRQHVAAFELALSQADETAAPKIPVVIVTGAREDDGEPAKRRAWVAFHRELAASIPQAQHIISTKSAHGIVSNEPELISKVIAEMIEQVGKAPSE